MDIKGHKVTRSQGHKFKNKKILITAGSTWSPIDSVRVISNVATGETGILLAQKLLSLGAKVTLLLGPVGAICLDKRVRLLRFKFFDELRSLAVKELRAKKYYAVIHSAAVSDYGLKNPVKGKISSSGSRSLKLIPLPKIIRDIRHLASGAKLAMFKLESGVSDRALLDRAKKAMLACGADLVIANRLDPYRAFIINRSGKTSPVLKTKNKLADELIKTMNHELI